VVTFIDEDRRVSVPGWVRDIEAFRRWTDEPDFPEDVYVCWLEGQVWLDFSRQQIFSHVAVKTEITVVLARLADEKDLGRYLTSGALLSNFAADISVKPDGLFFSDDTLASGRMRLVVDGKGGCDELQGSPDMVLEIVSASSEEKDTVVLKTAYWEAEIREYWLVDARKEPLQFDIFRRGSRGYTATRKQDGWVKSAVFGKSFRLATFVDETGYPDYTLRMR
jgi:Uma2 family endonuclease